MDSTYSRLPTDEATPPAPPSPRKSVARYRYILLVSALLTVAFASYKFSQSWSIDGPSATIDPVLPSASIPHFSTPTPTTTPAIDFEKPNSTTETTMPEYNHEGKGHLRPQIPSLEDPSSGSHVRSSSLLSRCYLTVYDPVSHILYAFANLKTDTGEVILSDDWADKDIHYAGDSWNDVGNNLYGNLKAIYKIKKANRHLKVLLSIGGWTYSPSFHPIVVNPALRATFVRTAVRLLEDYGFDGLDVDYEYPSNDEQARGYVALLQELRAALDRHAHEKRADYRFLLTIAAPCGPEHYKKLYIAEMDKSLDLWNMMAYDFSGSWDQIANHQANVFGGPISAAESIHYYVAQGVPRSKIVMGIPLYGRSFMNTQGPGTPFTGIGGGSWEAGVYDYRALPLPDSYVLRDDKALASWTYNYTTKEMVSFDSEEVGMWKGEWIKNEGLAGSMFWELSGDKGQTREGMESGPGKDLQPGNSLVTVVKNAMGGLRYDQHNWLKYEGSKFDNMRNGMPE
ncbi:hypothetical protein H0H92_009164 [Tricholoma furcatifolium]|nr:hypothetical protein H0H92_009164 [Tricholoma furcatifolium]